MDDGRHAHPHPHRPPPRGPDPARPGAREPRAAPSAGRPPTDRAASTPAPLRPRVLGPARPSVARLGGGRRHRPTRDRHPVAADRLQAVLDLEEPPARARPPRRRPGRPRADPHMARANPLWGAPRIHGELQKLGLEISQATVSKYLVRRRTPPSQTWRTFLANHVGSLVSVDFFTVPTVRSRSCSSLWSWRTTGDVSSTSTSPTPRPPSGRPSNSWRRSPGRRPRATSCATAMRSTGSCSRAEPRPWGSTKSRRRLGRLGRIRTWNASSGPCAASASTTSWCGTTRTCVACCETYLTDYHGCRTHLSLEKDAPEPRLVEHPDQGGIVEIPMVGGLHHRYTRQAA